MIRRLGIVGGVGPQASAHFYLRLIQLTPAGQDEDHLPVVLVSEPIPSRIANLLGRGPSPVPALRRAARMLAEAGADTVVIPSATTHAFHDEVALSARVPVLNLLAAVGAAIAAGGYRRPVFLATAATAALALYEPHLEADTVPLYPASAAQRRIDQLIDGVKRGAPIPRLRAGLTELLADRPWPDEADCAVLACTELPVIGPAENTAGIPLIDVTDVGVRAVLARRADG